MIALWLRSERADEMSYRRLLRCRLRLSDVVRCRSEIHRLPIPSAVRVRHQLPDAWTVTTLRDAARIAAPTAVADCDASTVTEENLLDRIGGDKAERAVP